MRWVELRSGTIYPVRAVRLSPITWGGIVKRRVRQFNKLRGCTPEEAKP